MPVKEDDYYIPACGVDPLVDSALDFGVVAEKVESLEKANQILGSLGYRWKQMSDDNNVYIGGFHYEDHFPGTNSIKLVLTDERDSRRVLVVGGHNLPDDVYAKLYALAEFRRLQITKEPDNYRFKILDEIAWIIDVF